MPSRSSGSPSPGVPTARSPAATCGARWTTSRRRAPPSVAPATRRPRGRPPGRPLVNSFASARGRLSDLPGFDLDRLRVFARLAEDRQRRGHGAEVFEAFHERRTERVFWLALEV